MLQKIVEARQLPAHLTEVLKLLSGGVEVVITDNRKPVARMISIHAPNGVPRLSSLHLQTDKSENEDQDLAE